MTSDPAHKLLKAYIFELVGGGELLDLDLMVSIGSKLNSLGYDGVTWGDTTERFFNISREDRTSIVKLWESYSRSATDADKVPDLGYFADMVIQDNYR